MRQSLRITRTLDVSHIGLDGPQLPPFEQGPIDLAAWFADPDRPLELEIGSGKGTFLVQQASQTPQINYIGLEYARSFWQYAADRCRRHGLENVRLVCIDADLFVRRYCPEGCFRQIHVYFPDPWPKKRHNKRRLIQAPFLRHLHQTLQSAGCVRLATDHKDYFQWMCHHAQQVAHLFEQQPFESPQSAGQGELAGTNFERKYRREGRPFFTTILKKLTPLESPPPTPGDQA